MLPRMMDDCGGAETDISTSSISHPPYYMRDSTLFHQKACTLPRHLPQILAMIYTVFWFIILCFLVERIYRLRKPHVIFLGRLTLLFHANLMLVMLTTVLEEGFYEFTAVSLTTSYLLVAVLMTLIMVDMLEFSSTLPRVKVEQMKRRFYTLLCVGASMEIFFGTWCVILARTEHLNTALSGLLLSNQIVATSATCLCYKYTNDFLTKTLRDEKMYSGLIQRIQRMKNTWVKLMGSLLLLPSTMVVLWAKNGYIPYQYVVCWSVLFLATLATIGLVSLFPRYSSSQSAVMPSLSERQHFSNNDDSTQPVSHLTAHLGPGDDESTRASSPVVQRTVDDALVDEGFIADEDAATVSRGASIISDDC